MCVCVFTAKQQIVKRKETCPHSAFYVGCKRDTARIRCIAPLLLVIDICCQRGAQQQTRFTLLQQCSGRMTGQTDECVTHRYIDPAPDTIQAVPITGTHWYMQHHDDHTEATVCVSVSQGESNRIPSDREVKCFASLSNRLVRFLLERFWLVSTTSSSTQQDTNDPSLQHSAEHRQEAQLSPRDRAMRHVS